MEDALETTAAARAPLAGFWRRLGAFAIDWLILALGGYMLGQLLFDPLAWLGMWGRLVGFLIALPYFGLLDSGAFGAATPGKRALGLRVVDHAGRVLPLPRSMLRAAAFLAPVMFNGTIRFMDSAGYGERAWCGLMGGLLAASFYVLIFNRATGQGLHDQLTGAYVIRGRASRQTMASIPAAWRPHLIVALAMVAVGIPAGLAGYPLQWRMSPATLSPVTFVPTLDTPLVRGVWMAYSPPTGGPRTCDRLTVVMRGTGVDDETIARPFVSPMKSHARCHIDTNLSVRMVYGFDLGFAGGVKYHDFTIDAGENAGQP